MIESIPFEYWRAQPVLTGPDIHYYGEPVALVVATTFEQARAAADLVEVEYTGGQGRFDFAAQEDEVYIPKVVNAGLPTDTAVGDFDAGFDSAAVKVDQLYTTPYELSMPMEPHACLVEPRGEELIVYVSCQIVDAARASVAATLRLDPERVHIVTPFVGGGFGSKLGIHSETILAALAARELRQPVKVAMTRQQIFQLVGNRPTTSQRVRLGAEHDGRLTAIAHDVTMHTNPDVEYAEQTAATTRSLYAAPHRLTSHRLAPLDLPPRDGRPRAGRGAGHAGGRVGDGRAGPCARDGPRRAADPQRAHRRSRARRAVQRPAPGRLPARRRAPVRLGAPPRPPRRACATGAGWSATACRPPSAGTSRGRQRCVCGWRPTAPPSSRRT